MKVSSMLFALPLLLLTLISCDKDDPKDNDLLDAIAADKYYNTDIISDSNQIIYGHWNLSLTSGGFGGEGYRSNFDEMLLKPNGIFGLVKDDELIIAGKLIVHEQQTAKLCVQFERDTTVGDPNTELFLNAMVLNVEDGELHFYDATLAREECLEITDGYRTQFERIN